MAPNSQACFRIWATAFEGAGARQSEERDDTVFTRPFIKQELLHDNTIFISVEKIISLYIQKYRFEHYENNQGKYREKIGPSKEIKGEN